MRYAVVFLLIIVTETCRRADADCGRGLLNYKVADSPACLTQEKEKLKALARKQMMSR